MLRPLALAAVLSLCAACLPGPATQPCNPGRTVSCTCAGGATGAQTCLEDGSGYDACVCETCDDGDLQSCTCPDGTSSTRECLDARFGDCDCQTSTPRDMGGDTTPDASRPSDAGFDASMPDAGAPDAGGADAGGECVPMTGSRCEDGTLRWTDSCGQTGDLVHHCGDGCLTDEMCDSNDGFCFGDCPTTCDLFAEPVAYFQLGAAARLGAPHHPSLDLPLGSAIDLFLQPDLGGMYGGSFEFTFSRFATESGLRVNFRAADGYRTPQKTTPLSCGTTYELERDTYIVEIGPTASEYVRIIISPPLD